MNGQDVLSDGKVVLKVRVRSAPEDGAANESVRRLIAKAVGRPASAVRLEAGATSRVKVLAIEGDPAEIGAALQQVAALGKAS